ncbi:hypothetical protein DAETH_22840 [Deinococcus aetherius]|uniref:Uncharacterized protein n=1 Tax=Deinococcus aetherius TaxID=200252 RepID=A0ABM8AF72_9DEIO|nr:hypothetical protein [Deinococcus aetherius]BDP42315.1 hypothetical protein DAETH_22840 [Deinococcus aetherius]
MTDGREKGQDDQAKTAQEGTMTEHGRWTPEVSKAADRELRELAWESPEAELGPATEGVDKSDLSLPTERHGGDH